MSEINGRVIKVLIGQVALTRSPNKLETVLGSCVGLVLYDEVEKIAGMAHIVLPESAQHEASNLPGKYADCAVACLLSALQEHGAQRKRLKAKFAGGACMFANTFDKKSSDIGSSNVLAVTNYLGHYAIPIIASDVGGAAGRKVVFNPATREYSIQDFMNRTQII